MSREKILAAVRQNQPSPSALPELPSNSETFDVEIKFTDTLKGIGGNVLKIDSLEDISQYLSETYREKRIISLVKGVGALTLQLDADPHLLENVEAAVVKGSFAVAENGAVWISDEAMGDRALPFITQHLMMIVSLNDIVPTMHEAYERIGAAHYNYGTFIAGPSKTADIEQSLVLGAHGPKSNTIFLIKG